MVKTYQSMVKDDAATIAEMGKIGEKMAEDQGKATDEANKKLQAASKEMLKTQDDIARVLDKGNEAYALNAIQIALSQGAITKHDAAVMTAAEHLKAYNAEMSRLNDEMTAAKSAGDLSEQGSISKQQAETQVQGKIQGQSDNAAINNTTFLTQMQQLFLVDWPSTMKQVLGNFVDDFNKDLLHSRNGKDLRRNLRNDLGKGADQVAQAGLKQAEGTCPEWRCWRVWHPC